MEFEYDEAKSAANKLKHGIDFEEAMLLWKGPVVQVSSPVTTEEERVVVFGTIEGKHWTVIITYRERRVRFISARR